MPQDLRQLHTDLLALIDQLEALTSETQPDRERITRLRWQLSRASRLRLKLLEEDIYPRLAQRAAPDELQIVMNLRSINAEDLTASRLHVATWTTDRAVEGWSNYCEASAQMRKVMRDRISMERAVLYPLIDRYGPS